MNLGIASLRTPFPAASGQKKVTAGRQRASTDRFCDAPSIVPVQDESANRVERLLVVTLAQDDAETLWFRLQPKHIFFISLRHRAKIGKLFQAMTAQFGRQFDLRGS